VSNQRNGPLDPVPSSRPAEATVPDEPEYQHNASHPLNHGIEESMKRLFALLCAPLLVLVALATPASAESPHFVRASASLSGTNLNVSFKEAGLGDNQLISYAATADATATYVCVNRGGANPSASNKTTVSGPVIATGSFNSGKNGTISQTLTLSPPSAGSFSCPSGQTLAIAQVTYTNVAIADTTNDVTQSIPGTFSTGCLLPDVRGAC
jgi:hypothetical protein